MWGFIPLAILASVATAVPADSARNGWESIPAATVTRTPAPTISTKKAGWSSWAHESSTTRSAFVSETTWAAWNTTTTRSPIRQWEGWNTKDLPPQSALPSSGGGYQWGPPSDPYSLWDDRSSVGGDDSPSRTWNDWSDAGDGSSPLDSWFTQRPAPDPSVPTATLLPTVHWSHNGASPEHIKPQDSTTQYYMPSSASSRDTHQFGWLSTNFTNNAIMLDHSSLLDYTYVASTGALTVTFSDDYTFSLAQSSWHVGLIMVFYDGTCGSAMNCFAICQQLTFESDSKTCVMSTTSATFEEVASYITFQWGNCQPGRGRGGSSGGSWTDWQPTAVAPGNYTFGDDNHNDGCTAPPDKVYGLPTACLGQFFDEDLDDFYGYETLAETDFANSATTFPHLWYDGVIDDNDLDSSDYSDDDAALILDKRLDKRFDLSDLNPLKHLKKLAQKVLPAVPGLTAPYNIPLISLPIPLNAPKSKKTVQSYWGPQVLIRSFKKSKKGKSGVSGSSYYGKLDLYCVDCGASGTANIAGSIGVSLLQGIDHVRADLDMNLAIGLKLGVVAEFEYNQLVNEPLFTVPLSPLTIGIVTIGPYLKAGVELDLKLVAEGRILGGGTMSFNKAHVSLDVTNFNGNANGWTPSFVPAFEADGKIAARADFGVPIAIALGISVLKYSADVSLVDRPGIVAKAQASASANLNGAGFVDYKGCKGISVGLDFKNDVYAQFAVGSFKKKADLFNLPEKSLYSTCIAPAATRATIVDTEEATTTMEQVTSTPADEDHATMTITTTEAEPTPTHDHEPTAATTEETTSTAVEIVATTSPGEKRSFTTKYFRRQDNTSSLNTTDDGTIIDTTTQTIASNGTTNNTAFVVPDGDNFNYTRTDGYIFSNLIDPSETYEAYACSDGNIHVFGINETITTSDCQGDFAMFEDLDSGLLVIADGFARMFVYYPDEMNKTGVSRIRAVDVENIPRGTEEVIWFPDSTDDTAVDAPIYFPFNQNGDAFYPAMCKYTDSSLYNKLFIMSDPDAGLLTLKDPALKYSITGGDIDSCYFIPLMEGGDYDEEHNEDDLYYTSVPGEDNDIDTTSTTSSLMSTAARSSATVVNSTTATTGFSSRITN